MKVLLTGATGFVGGALGRRLREGGHEVHPVSRRPGAGVGWGDDSLRRGVAECDAIIHLAGENIFGRRWSAAQKERLRTSRIDTTRRLAELAAEEGAGVLLMASGIGYYGASEDGRFDEDSPAGDDFLARLCADWERAAAPAAEAGVRLACARLGVVMGPGGGALERMLLPFRLGLGGRLGSGRQWFSWVHLDDVCDLLVLLLEREDLAGPFNFTAPGPVTNAEFTRTLGRVLRRPTVLPAPAFALRLALGEAAEVLLTGQHVSPRRAREAGYTFRHPELEDALRASLA